MNNKVLELVSSSDKKKALTGMMYAVNAFKNPRVNDVNLIRSFSVKDEQEFSPVLSFFD